MVEKTEILNGLLQLATDKWGCDETEKMRQAFERAAEAIWKVMCVLFEAEEDPTYSPLQLFQTHFSSKNGDD